MRIVPFPETEGEFLVRDIMRNDAREAAFRIVFARLFGGDCDERFRTGIYRKAKLNPEEKEFAERIVALTEEHSEEIRNILSEKVTRFADYRIYGVDKAVLFVALAEILYMDDVPPIVSVSEAAALARKYSTENSASFVNGVLAGVINK